MADDSDLWSLLINPKTIMKLCPALFCFLQFGEVQQRRFTHFDDESAGKVEQRHHSAPVELPV